MHLDDCVFVVLLLLARDFVDMLAKVVVIMTDLNIFLFTFSAVWYFQNLQLLHISFFTPAYYLVE